MRNYARQYSAARGFISFEMIVVLSIIALFAALAFPRFIEVCDRGYVEAARCDLANMSCALSLYATDYNSYPEVLSSYEEFRNKMVKPQGEPILVLPPDHTFRWISYDAHSNGNYLLIIQALDRKKTTMKASADGIQIEP
jgi:type II secretory pathway pseudopilin PulG